MNFIVLASLAYRQILNINVNRIEYLEDRESDDGIQYTRIYFSKENYVNVAEPIGIVQKCIEDLGGAFSVPGAH